MMRKYVHLRQSAFNCAKCTLHKDICIIVNIQLSFKTLIKRGEERFREEGETAKKDREEGERQKKK